MKVGQKPTHARRECMGRPHRLLVTGPLVESYNRSFHIVCVSDLGGWYNNVVEFDVILNRR